MYHGQSSYIHLDSSVSNEYELCGGDETESNLWIRELTKCSKSVLSLPELPLQKSISADLDDFDNPQLSQRKEHDLATKHISNAVKTNGQPKCSRSSQELGAKHPPKDVNKNKIDQIKCSRSSQVHNSSEKRRRHRINGKLKALQELMPRCERNDKAYVLDEAAKYIKALKLQLETMSNPGRTGIESLFAQMQCLAYQINQYQNPSPFSTVMPSLRIDNNNNNNGMSFGAHTSPILPFIQPSFPCLPFPYTPTGNSGYLSQPYPPSFGQQQFQPNFVASDKNGGLLQ